MPINSPTKPAAPFSEGAIRSLFAAQRAHFREAGTPDYQRRKQSLRRLRAYLGREANIRGLVDALRQDLRKPEVETLSSELGVVMSHLRYVDSGLRRWMEPKPLPASLSQAGIKSYLYLEPKGNALIIAPWNYPFNLTVVPLIYAISAGCTAIVKPSEMSPATTAYIQRMLDEVFDEREVKVVTGDAQTASLLTTLPFDHIFFTGSPAIGKRVMAAAAENLTSVTLELGGKSPAVIDRGVDLRKSAENTVWGKFFNAAQTCIAPDYLLVDHSQFDSYVAELRGAITRFYGEDPQASDSYARIVNHRHFDRLEALYDDALSKGATVVCGGVFDREDRYVAPTLLTGVTEDMRVMQEEIFGPLWPALPYRDLGEAIAIINRRPKPLSFYIQSNDRKTIDRLKRSTSSGGILVNEYLLGGGSPTVPFGGVNNSGIGKSFGYHGFVEFSNERAVMERKLFDLSIGYPPYTDRVTEIFRRLYKWM